jgi:hypothetical protein
MGAKKCLCILLVILLEVTYFSSFVTLGYGTLDYDFQTSRTSVNEELAYIQPDQNQVSINASTLDIDKELVLNGVWYRLHNTVFSLRDLAMSVMIYNFLGEEIPLQDSVVAYFDSFQNEDGSFGNTHGYGVIQQTFILMAYRILDSKPAKTLDPWFAARASDWDIIVKDAQTYSPTNFWCTIIGYPLSYFVYYDRVPPWMEDYFTLAKDSKQTWMSTTHQRNHVTVPYIVLGRSMPYLESILSKTLEEQQTTGSWDDDLGETEQVIHNILQPFSVSARLDLAVAISTAQSFVRSCYYETVVNSSTRIAGFWNNPQGKKTTWVSNFFGTMAAIEAGLLKGNTDPLFREFAPSSLL